MGVMPPTKRVDILKDRNEKLSAQLTVQRGEMNRLQRRVTELEEQENARRETLLCVNRLWEELNDSLSFLSFRAKGTGGVQDTDAGNSPPPDTDLLLEEEDPFMAKLLTTFLEGDKAAETMLHRISQDASAVETRLRKRMAATMASASALLEIVEALRSGSTGSSISDEPKSKEVQLAALSNVLRAENKRLRDQALQDASRIKELSNSLADREDELLVAQRKIAQLRQNPEAHLPVHTLPSHTHSPAPVKENDSSEELEKKPAPAAPNGGRDSTVVNVKELQDLQGQLERRAAEVEARDVALSAAEREARHLRAKLASEREAAARARQYESDRSAHLSSELDALDTRLRDITRDRDHILSKLREAQAETDKAAATARRLANVQSEVATLETALRTAREARSEAETEAIRLRAEVSKLPTVKELERLLDVQAKELESLKSARQERHKVSEAADAVRKEANEALKALSEAQARESAANEKAETLAGLLRDAETKEEELQLFVQVALEFLGRNSMGENENENENDVASIETLKSEVRAFCKEFYSSKSLPSHASAIFDEEVLALHSENAKLKTQVQGLQAEVSRLEADITALKDEGESFFKELESVTEAYESLKEQNARLIDGIKARDEDNVRLMGEASTAAMERAVALDDLLVEKEAARKAEHEMQVTKSQAEELESRVHELGRELDGVRKELTMANSRGDAAARERDATQAALSAVRRDMEEAEKSATRTREERDAEEERARKALTRAERAEAELLDARKGRDSLKSAGGDDGQLVAECTALRKMVNCNVCHTRLKDRIITKCNHIFCSQCIEANLATRHRKCPGCAERFGAGDVKPFFFT